ncbi:Putative protein in type-1 retrotransposable element R1DM [Araneus ventricosus]|uniref:Retrovirus-related Pol polyprotein from type-1 retrotransposable element R1 n=1 Tax=Araneus ventricosus TaxID=182803 RepID=A0A4Y2ED52_ARAVE|nr:Putative protein in type-1 retrotransposable element R1DM [Araneus ventricosus]
MVILISDGNPNNSFQDKMAFIMNSFFPGHSASDDFFYTPVMDSVEPIKLEDLELVFNNLKGDHNNIIHNNQYGFREGRSCDLAIQNIVDIIREKSQTHHIALISLDIKSAFDNMNWSVLFKLFDDLNFPKFFRNFIFHYLNNRTVSFSNEIVTISRACFRGCPQGSVVAPTIWNIYINPILERNNTSFYTQAFADDLALIISGRTARELEANTNIALAEIAQHLQEIKLSLSVHKCQALVFRSVSSRKFSKRNSTILNRKPTFKINNFSIKISDSLKILGIVLDNKLTWTAHISSLYSKILSLTSNFNRVIKSDWSMNRNILKIWYSTVIEKALLYGASIWGGALTKHHISRLHSFQRVFLLRFTRAYKTTSTNVLNVLTGIPPLHITAKAEFCKFQIWVRRSPSYNHIINNIPLDYNINIRNIPSEQKSIVLPSTIQEADFEVYTDGSRIDNETGLAVCTFQQNDNVSNFLFKLNSYNSVFQAELEAIHFACNWALQNNYKINIHTDSLSSILAIQSANSRSGFVYSVKQDIFKARHLVGLSWVKAHVGIPGNEWADQQAKSAINLGTERLIPAPRSFLRRALKQQILNEWNEYFMNYNSASGTRARDFIDKVDFNFLITNKFLIFFLCGHGPFPFYLNRFKLLDSPSCICGEVGDADHYVFSCSLTKDFHLSRPADAHKKAWFRNTMHNRQAVTKISEAFRISAGICDSLTRDGSS